MYAGIGLTAVTPLLLDVGLCGTKDACPQQRSASNANIQRWLDGVSMWNNSAFYLGAKE